MQHMHPPATQSGLFTEHAMLSRFRMNNDSLGCVCASCSSVPHVQGASFLPVLGEGGAHVTLHSLDGPNHQVIHWNREAN